VTGAGAVNATFNVCRQWGLSSRAFDFPTEVPDKVIHVGRQLDDPTRGSYLPPPPSPDASTASWPIRHTGRALNISVG